VGHLNFTTSFQKWLGAHACWARESPASASRRLAEVSSLVPSCDRSTPIGSRDFALLTLLARMGLRSAKWPVWSWATSTGGAATCGSEEMVEQRLPFPDDVGETLAAYLRDARPRVESRKVS
jgi:integrase/recombinase XerD